MQDITYIFIDGGYLKDAYNNTVCKLFGNQFEIDYAQIKNAFNARRVFYYDCIDDKQKPGESDSDFHERVQKQEEHLDFIDALEGIHVRRGHLARGRMNQQKEVDVLLAVDMMNHAFNRNMTKAVLISGDRDFRPVVQSVANTGTYVQVMFRRANGAKDLGRAADFVEYLDVTTLILWTAISPGDSRSNYFPASHHQNFNSIANRDNHKETNHILIKTGTLNASSKRPTKIRAYELTEQGGFAFYVDNDPLALAIHAFKDFTLLEQFITLQYGPFNWTT